MENCFEKDLAATLSLLSSIIPHLLQLFYFQARKVEAHLLLRYSTSDLQFISIRSNINFYRSSRDFNLTSLYLHTTKEIHTWNAFLSVAYIIA